MNIISYVLKKIEKTASYLGSMINQNPSEEENRKVKAKRQGDRSWIFRKPSVLELAKRKISRPKEVYAHKGSGYKGKGQINRDTATFNKPRKGLFPGRSH